MAKYPMKDTLYFTITRSRRTEQSPIRETIKQVKLKGDDETIYVDLEKVTAAVEEMVFVVTIHDAHAKHQNFSQIRNAFIRLG